MQNWQNLSSDILSLRFTITGTTAVYSKSHIANEKYPFVANTIMSRREGRYEGSEELLGFERDLDLKRSEAEKIVAATEASQATIVCKSAIRVRCRKRSSCEKTDELGPKKVLARESDISG
jgi:hypothetical protein